MPHLNISYSENSVPKAFSSWVGINKDKEGIGIKVSQLLSENDLEAALSIYNIYVGGIIRSEGHNPDTVTFH